MSEASTSLALQIDQDLKTAMRSQDNVTKLVLRAVKTAIAKESKAIGAEYRLSDEEVMEVLQREAKGRRDAAAEYGKAGRTDRVDEELAELAVLERYLPRQLGEDEILAIAQEVIAEVGAESPQDMGRVMSAMMPRVAGVADGRQVNQIVRSLLS